MKTPMKLADVSSQITTAAELLRGHLAAADAELEASLRQRENLDAIPRPRDEVCPDVLAVLEQEAGDFERIILGMIHQSAMARGSDKSYRRRFSVLRPISGQLDERIVSWAIFDLLKAKLENMVATCEWPGGAADGKSSDELELLIEEADVRVDTAKQARDEVVAAMSRAGIVTG